jgi:hypothetical protein
MIVAFAMGLLFGVLGTLAVVYVWSGREIRKLCLDYKLRSQRHVRAIAALENHIKKLIEISNGEGEKLS